MTTFSMQQVVALILSVPTFQVESYEEGIPVLVKLDRITITLPSALQPYVPFPSCVAESFITRQKSDEALEVLLEDSLLYFVSYEEYRNLAKEDVLIANLIIQMLEQQLVIFSER